MKPSIRPMKKEDLPALSKLILDAENFGQPFLKPELHNLKWYSIPDLGAVYVATIKSEPVGYIILRRKVFSATIVSIIVEKNKQRKGIGKALIEKAREYAKSQGLNVLRVDTANFMDYAIKFYLACGFLPCGYVEHDFGLNMRQVHFYIDLTQ